MKEFDIRGKAVFYVLFACMILFSIWAQENQEEIRTAAVQKEQKYLENAASSKEKDSKEAALTQEGAGEIQTDGALAPRVALTFDDGPHPSYTKKLLDGLKERGVKATFFVIGKNIDGQEELIRQMMEDGHIIGNHTYNHSDISKMGTQRACEELTKTSCLVEEITGQGTSYVRAPFGNWDKNLDCELSMINVSWTVDPLDWTTENTAQVVEKVVTQAKDNDIILLHDYYQSSVDAALQIVDILTERGFQFVTVEELLLE